MAEDYKIRFECISGLMRKLIKESNDKNDLIGQLQSEIRRLKEAKELRYNPYHDPNNGRFTSSDGSKGFGYFKKTEILEKEFGKLKTNKVILTEERSKHIRERHADDYSYLIKYGKSAIENPDFIIKDEKNINTVFVIKKLPDTNLNIIVKLVLSENESNIKNSIMTSYRIRDKNVKKLKNKNKTLYKKE